VLLTCLPQVIHLVRPINYETQLHHKQTFYGEPIAEIVQRRLPWYQQVSNYTYSVTEGSTAGDLFNRWVAQWRYPFQVSPADLMFCYHPVQSEKMVATIDQYASGTQVIEFRADLLETHSEVQGTTDSQYIDRIMVHLQDLFRFTYRPILFTYRYQPKQEALISQINQRALRAGVSLLDVDLSSQSVISPPQRRHAKLVGSFHSDGQLDIQTVLAEGVSRHRPDIIKLVCSQSEAIRLGWPTEYNNTPVMLLVTGPLGRLSRITSQYLTPVMSPLLGTTHPDQFSVKQLCRHRRDLLPQNKLEQFYLFGSPIEHSKSPSYHNKQFSDQNRPAYYQLCDTTSPDKVREKCREPLFRGASVTIPLKEQLMEVVDLVGEEVRAIGALNTITRQSDGRLRGNNTDYRVMYEFLTDLTPPRRQLSVLIIGTGGSARAACYACQQSGVNFAVWGRNTTNCERLAREFSGTVIQGQFNLTQHSGIICCIIPEVALDFSSLPEDRFIIELAYGAKLNRTYPTKIKWDNLVTGAQFLTAQAEYQQILWEKT
jgi:pentafunctional AROM polypeptide